MRTLCIRVSELDYSRMRTCAEVGGVSISQLIRTAIANSLRDVTGQPSAYDIGLIEVRLGELAREVHDLSRMIDHLRLLMADRDTEH